MRSTVSILTTLYNHQDYILETLNSAIYQSYPPSQIVVIDDASTDDSIAITKQIRDPRIELHLGNYNLGGPNTVKGLSLCTGDFVAILNSDDLWDKDKLGEQIAYLDTHPNCGAIFTRVQIIDENSQPWLKGTNSLESLFAAQNRPRNEWLRHFFHFGNAFCASSAMIRREIFDRLGLFDARYIQLQDFEMWLRIALAGYDLYIINEPLTYYRVMRNGTNMSASNIKGKALFEFEYAKILKSYWSIKTLIELKSIFPEMDFANKADDSMVLFYLAQYSLKLPTWHHRMFSLETMSQWGGDLHSMTLAYECHNFSHKSFSEFLSDGPIREMIKKSWKWRIELLLNNIFSYSTIETIKERLRVIFRKCLILRKLTRQ